MAGVVGFGLEGEFMGTLLLRLTGFLVGVGLGLGGGCGNWLANGTFLATGRDLAPGTGDTLRACIILRGGGGGDRDRLAAGL